MTLGKIMKKCGKHETGDPAIKTGAAPGTGSGANFNTASAKICVIGFRCGS